MTFCNGTKGVVGTGDKKCPATSCLRWTNRWPISLLYSLIDKVCLNSFLIYIWNNEKEGLRSWRIFLRLLGKELLKSLKYACKKNQKNWNTEGIAKYYWDMCFKIGNVLLASAGLSQGVPKGRAFERIEKPICIAENLYKPICKKHHGPPTSKDFVVYKERVKEKCKRKFLVLFLFQFFCLLLLSV